MDRGRITVTVSLALLLGVMLATKAIPAERFNGQVAPGHPPAVSPPIAPHGPSRFPGLPGVAVPRPVAAHVFPSHPFAQHPVANHHRFLVPFGVPAAPVVIYAPSFVSGPGYAPSPASFYYPDDWGYSSAAISIPAGSIPAGSIPAGTTLGAPPPAPMPNVVEYATGRYELRGDGLTVPYTWVWIPNPPAAPPGGASFQTPPPSPSHDRLYRWTDTQGVLHVTDRWEAVPPEYRVQAKPPEPS